MINKASSAAKHVKDDPQSALTVGLGAAVAGTTLLAMSKHK